jgi:hypothetical protein
MTDMPKKIRLLAVLTTSVQPARPQRPFPMRATHRTALALARSS